MANTAVAEQSRYGTAPAIKFTAPLQNGVVTDAAQVAPEFARLRKVFDSDRTLSEEWRQGQLRALVRMMEEGRGELHAALKADLGKSPFESDVTEIDLVLQEARHAQAHLSEWMVPHAASISPLNQPGKGETVSDPLGVVLIMGAWNYPVQLTLAPVVGAIAAGNCVVIKPGSYAPHTSHAIAKLVVAYLDRDAVLVCEGDRTMNDALLKQKFNMMFFTGSGFVGRMVARAAAENLCPVVLELGGKSPCVVDKSADLDVASDRLVWGTFLNSGQTCIRPDHCLVHADVADEFIEACKRKVIKFYGAEPQKTEWFGRIINDKAYDRLAQLVVDSKAKIVHGGRCDKSAKFIEPTLFDFGTDLNAFDQSTLMGDEIFGPLLPIARFRDLEQDVVQRVRRLPTGKPLALYVFATEPRVIDELTRRTTSGGMCVNDTLMHVANHDLPFGGVGESGQRSYHGHRSFQVFSHEKAVLTKWTQIDALPIVKDVLRVRFPPYTPAKQTVVRLLGNPSVLSFMEALERPAVQRVMLLLALWLGFRRLGLRIVRNE